jgi:hypothetical protein
MNAGTWSSRLGVGRKADDCSVKKLLLRNPKKWKPDAIWQRLLKKVMAKKGCFESDDDDDDVCEVVM